MKYKGFHASTTSEVWTSTETQTLSASLRLARAAPACIALKIRLTCSLQYFKEISSSEMWIKANIKGVKCLVSKDHLFPCSGIGVSEHD